MRQNYKAHKSRLLVSVHRKCTECDYDKGTMLFLNLPADYQDLQKLIEKLEANFDNHSEEKGHNVIEIIELTGSGVGHEK